MSTSTIPALSIRQPWAWLIVNGFKPIENRTWPTMFRGMLLIHAGKTMTVAEYDAALLFINTFIGPDVAAKVPAMDKLERGGFVGVANMVDCVRKSESPWFTGADTDDGHGFVMADPWPIHFHPYKGKLGFFNVPSFVPIGIPAYQRAAA
ncbi:MAG: ASCH domain-containing protein [Pseudomonadota bacterium]